MKMRKQTGFVVFHSEAMNQETHDDDDEMKLDSQLPGGLVTNIEFKLHAR